MRWARIEAKLAADGRHLCWAQGDDRGEFLLLLGRLPEPMGNNLSDPLSIVVAVYGPAQVPVASPAPGPQGRCAAGLRVGGRPAGSRCSLGRDPKRPDAQQPFGLGPRLGALCRWSRWPGRAAPLRGGAALRAGAGPGRCGSGRVPNRDAGRLGGAPQRGILRWGPRALIHGRAAPRGVWAESAGRAGSPVPLGKDDQQGQRREGLRCLRREAPLRVGPSPKGCPRPGGALRARASGRRVGVG
jgi:hypothetical protein